MDLADPFPTGLCRKRGGYKAAFQEAIAQRQSSSSSIIFKYRFSRIARAHRPDLALALSLRYPSRCNIRSDALIREISSFARDKRGVTIFSKQSSLSSAWAKPKDDRLSSDSANISRTIGELVAVVVSRRQDGDKTDIEASRLA